MESYITNADTGVSTTGGAITLEANETAKISALSAAASAAVAIGGSGAGVSLSGAGAEATNVILNKTNAYVENSVLNSAGDVDLDAVNASEISALVLTASISASASGTAGIGASIGAALARNWIGWTLDYQYTTSSLTQEVKNGDTVSWRPIMKAAEMAAVYTGMWNRRND